MYHIYQTEGLVVGRAQRGEQDVVVSILTKDPSLGLVRARATSAATVASRLRYALEPLTEGRYAFVRGKHQWRLVGAAAFRWSAPAVVRSGNDAAIAAFLQFLREVIPSEGAIPEGVVSVVEQLVAEAARCPQLSLARVRERTAAVLHLLGYLPAASAGDQASLLRGLWAAGR